MIDHKDGDGAKSTHANKKPSLVCRGISNIKYYFQQRSAEKKKESAIDRAAQSTARATWAIAFLTVVTIVVGVSQYFTFNRQLSVMQDQLKIMEADQRPWISLEMQIDGPLTHNVIGWQLLIKYNLKNIGKSPADDVDFLAVIIPADPPRPNNDGSPKAWATPTAAIDTAVDNACKKNRSFGARWPRANYVSK